MLISSRTLLTPAEAADTLGISRQAVEKSAARGRGHLLMWILSATTSPQRRRDRRYLDFGRRGEPADPHAWEPHRDNPADLIAAAGLGRSSPPGEPSAGDDTASPAAVATPEPSLRDRDGLMVLHLVASGAAAFAERSRGDGPIRLPYPEALQKGLDRLTALCWRRGVEPPVGVPDLLRWCRTRPLVEWPLRLAPGVAGPDDRLLDGPFPTALCREWAVDARDVEHEVFERQLIGDVFALCQRAGDQAGYVAFRSLLIRRPVLTALELHTACATPALAGLAEQVRDAYQPIPLEWVEDGHVILCAACDGPLVRTRGGTLRCADDRCPGPGGRAVARRIAAREDVAWLKPALRTFIAAPGRAELRLANRLGRLGLAVELWPALDAYDLRVTFPDGAIWGVDVKDWASPVALARHLSRGETPFPAHPARDLAFFVFPQERLRRRPDYLRAFLAFARGIGPGTAIGAVMEETFLDLARRHLRAAPGPRLGGED